MALLFIKIAVFKGSSLIEEISHYSFIWTNYNILSLMIAMVTLFAKGK